MADTQPAVFPFDNRGVVIQTQPSALKPGEYAELKNLVSRQEGSLWTRNGRQLLNVHNAWAGGDQSFINTIAKLTVSTTDDTQNPRYFAALGELFRTDSAGFVGLPASGAPWFYNLLSSTIADPAAPHDAQKVGAVRYNAGAIGAPWIFFACQKKMLKDNGQLNSGDGSGDGTILHRWGILPPTRPATAVVGGSVTNGPNASPNTYTYVYVFVNTVTGAVSNPSVLMVGSVSPVNQAVTVTVGGTGDPQVTGANSIRIYRAGGAFGDGIYRVVGYATNPGAGATTTFSDIQADTNIEFNDPVEFDNDPPITSSLPNPIGLAFSSWSSGSGAAGALSTAVVTVSTGPSDPRTTLPPGSTVTIAPNGANQETARIISWPSALHVQVFLQNDHTALSGGNAFLTADAATGSPCNLALAAFDSIFVAGDANNPHVLYKSKTGRPESFPIQEIATGIPLQINVGSPSDPIVAITEFNGGILCLNESSINWVGLFQGVMQAPIRTPAQRGLISAGAWCEVNHEIWYAAYDGIYSWSGNVAEKRSERIEQFFHSDGVIPNYVHNGSEVSPFPIDFTKPYFITAAFHNSYVLITFVDIDFFPWRFRYDTIYDRWSWDEQMFVPGIQRETITAQYKEPDTGALLTGSSITTLTPGGTTRAYVMRDDVGLSDAWVNAPDDGTPIQWGVTTAALTVGVPSLQKVFQDYILELNNDNGGTSRTTYTQVQFFYDFGTTPDGTDVINISPDPLTDGRKRIAYPLQNGWGKEAYAMQVRVFGQGLVVLYSQTVNWFPLEQTQAGRAFDWDDLGYPWDKKLRTVTVEYDTLSGYTVPLNLDIMQGVGVAQRVEEAFQTFQLSAPGGSFTGPSHVKINLPINDNTVVKKVRLRPTLEKVGNPTLFHRFKLWPGYLFDFEKYPEDIVFFTPWNDLGYKYEKVIQVVRVVVNSNNVPLQIQLQGDTGTILGSWTVTTTLGDRIRVLTVVSSAMVRQARLVFTPGSGGMAQVFDWSAEYAKEPPLVSYWSTFEQDFGVLGWRWIKKAWIEYYGPGGLTVNFYRENRQLFWTQAVTAQHTQRDTESFYLPPNGFAYNKSRLHTVEMLPADGSSAFKVYGGTRLELVPFGADQRQGAVQVPIAELMQPLGGS